MATALEQFRARQAAKSAGVATAGEDTPGGAASDSKPSGETVAEDAGPEVTPEATASAPAEAPKKPRRSRAKKAAPVDDEAAVAPSAPEVPASEAGAAPTEDAWAYAVTPSGIEIRFLGGDKHDYQIRPDKNAEWYDVPSVSALKDILDKPAIVRWAVDLVAQGALNDKTWPIIRKKSGDEAALKYLKSYPWEHRDKAGKRGTSVHNGMEFWATSGTLPKPELYDEVERPFVEGLNAFLTESGLVCRQAEVMVGSVDNGYAGRFDIDGILMDDVELVSHLTPKGQGTRKSVFPAGPALWDLKTSSGVYLDMFFQLEFYNYAYVENGYGDAFPNKYIVRVTDDGRYEVKRSKADWVDAMALKMLYDGLERMKADKGD